VVNFTPRQLYPPRERAPGTHWIGGWVSPRTGLDDDVHNLYSSPDEIGVDM